MAVGTRTTTTASSLNTLYRKVQADLEQGFNVECEEWGWIDSMEDWEYTLSPREMLVPVDVRPAPQGAMIPDGGTEADPYTPDVVEASVSLVQMNARFALTRFQRAFASAERQSAVTNMMRRGALKRLEGMANKVGFQFYGFSTGILAEVGATGAAAATVTITLRDAFGDDNLDDAAYLDQLLNVGDKVAIANGTTLRANGFGEVTARGQGGAASTATIVFFGTCTPTIGDNIFIANNAIDSTGSLTLADHSDYNKWPVGLKDAIESTSVHGLAESSLYHWQPALEVSTAGRFTPVKLLKMRQAIGNFGGGKLQQIVISNGVWNDLSDQQGALARFSDLAALPTDLGAKAPAGARFLTSRKVPPGHVFGMDKSAIKKLALTSKPGEDAGEVDKLQDKAQYVFGDDFVYAFAVCSRRKLAEYRQQTEQ